MAGQSTRQIKRKIKGIKNVRKITRAMQMVSAAKLKRVEKKVDAIRPYWEKIRDLMGNLVDVAETPESELFKPREEVNTTGFIVIAGDKGLCGGYNSDVFDRARKEIQDLPDGVDPSVIAVGKKTVREFESNGPEPVDSMTNLPTEPSFEEARSIAKMAEERFRNGEMDEVYIVFTRYKNALNHWPSTFQFLPVTRETISESTDHEEDEGNVEEQEEDGRTDEERIEDMIFEPEPSELFNTLIPRYVNTLFYDLLLESLSSEHGARMVAMRNATDNAEDMIEDLTHSYNQARQQNITRELLEIVGAVEAM